MNIGKSVKVGLALKEKNQNWLAKELGTSVAYVSSIARGSKSCSAKRILELAVIFGVSASIFISWGE